MKKMPNIPLTGITVRGFNHSLTKSPLPSQWQYNGSWKTTLAKNLKRGLVLTSHPILWKSREVLSKLLHLITMDSSCIKMKMCWNPYPGKWASRKPYIPEDSGKGFRRDQSNCKRRLEEVSASSHMSFKMSCMKIHFYPLIIQINDRIRKDKRIIKSA